MDREASCTSYYVSFVLFTFCPAGRNEINKALAVKAADTSFSRDFIREGQRRRQPSFLLLGMKKFHFLLLINRFLFPR